MSIFDLVDRAFKRASDKEVKSLESDIALKKALKIIDEQSDDITRLKEEYNILQVESREPQKVLKKERKEHTAEIKDIRESYDKEINGLQQKHQEAIKSLESQHLQELRELSSKHSDELQALEESLNSKHDKLLHELEHAYDYKLQEAKLEHERTILVNKEKMLKAVSESDIKREIYKSKLEVYEGMDNKEQINNMSKWIDKSIEGLSQGLSNRNVVVQTADTTKKDKE